MVPVGAANYAFGVGSAGQGIPTLHPKARRESCDRTPTLDRFLLCPPPPASRKIPIIVVEFRHRRSSQNKEREPSGVEHTL